MRKLILFPFLGLAFGCEAVPMQPIDGKTLAAALSAGSPIPSSEWIRITTDPHQQLLPKIDGYLIVWEDTRNGNIDIYMHDLSTGQELPVETDGAEQRDPDVSGSRIVWQDLRSGNWDVWMYDAVSGAKEQITDDPGNEILPRISGNRIVWQGDVQGGMPGEAGVYVHDLTDGSTRLLQPEYALAPEIDGDLIVSWWHCPYHPWRGVCLYDLARDETRSISPAHGEDDRGPVISGDFIAWERYPAPGWPVTPRDIYAYNLVSGLETQITNDTRDHHWPRVSGNRIVWVVPSNDCGGADLLLHDFQAAGTTRLGCGTGFRPDISGHRVVFIAGANDVYMIELATLVEIDIKPDGKPNCIKDGSKGRTAIAILASPEFDPSQVDPVTVNLDGVVPLRWSLNKDVNGDGLRDLVFHFYTPELSAAGLLVDGGSLTLHGELLDGTPIEGSDVIHLAGGPVCS